MSATYLSRTTDAASYAMRLQANLIRITAALDIYRGSPGLELMRERSHVVQGELGAISGRLNTFGRLVDLARAPLSKAEHMALEAAGDLCERMRESLARYERGSVSRA
jgi:hypothetical protein